MERIRQTFLYVLEHSNGDIFYIDITNRENEDIEDILYEYGYQADQCSYMILNERITKIKQIR